MIDLSQYEIGQRFRTLGGRVAELVDEQTGDYYWLTHSDGLTRPHSKDGLFARIIAYSEPYDLITPIYRVPARTRRLPKPNPMPTGYERQWPHLHQMGGGATLAT